MNGQIFVSYRREDASYPAGRLYDQLQSRFPQNEIFMDVDSIKPGIDFVQTIEERVGACDVFVAVIGKRWLSAADEEGRRRLDNPEDFVRVEVGTALKRGVRVIPVLVEGASMPPASQLPEELKPLARRNALSVSHERFRADAEQLMDSVGEVLEAAQAERPPRPPEGQPRGRAPGKGKPEPLPGLGAGPGAPAPDRTPLKGITANLKRPGQLLVLIGIGIVVCLLGVSLFKAKRPQPVSLRGSSSPHDQVLAESDGGILSGLDPSLDYTSYDSSKLNLEFVYPQAQLTVDTTQEDRGVIPLLSPQRKVEVVIRRTNLPEHNNIRIGRDMEERKVRDLGYSVNYLGPREERNWSDWYIISGTKPDGSEYFYKRWYTNKDVVSIEFDYPRERLEVYNKIIPHMTLKRFWFK